ncbi:MAG: hypothetical protein ACJ71P_01480 [Nitrososphaeraceae archaeon]
MTFYKWVLALLCEIYLYTTRAPNIKHNSPEVKDVCYFAERVRHMLDVKINHLRIAMYRLKGGRREEVLYVNN